MSASFARGPWPHVFSPLPYLGLFLFFIVTSLNLESELLRLAHAELLLVAAVLGLVAGRPDLRARLLTAPVPAIALASAALALAPVLASLANADYLAVLGNEELHSWVKALAVAPLFLVVFDDDRRRRWLLDLLLVSLAVFGVVFLYRFFVLGEAREYDLRPTLRTKNGDPNFICTFFAVGIPLALFRVGEAWESGRRPAAVAASGLAALFAACAVVTESRMGLLSIGASLVYLVARAPLPVRRGRLVAGLLGIAAVLAVAYGPSVWHRFATLNDESSHGRVRSFVNGATMFLESPLFGKGWDASPETYFQNAGYPLFRSDAHAISVHDTPLQLAADLGAYGLVAYLALFWLVARRIRGGTSRGRRAAYFCAASLLALGLNYLTLPLETKDFAIVFLGVLAALTPARAPQSGGTAIRPCRPSSLP